MEEQIKLLNLLKENDKTAIDKYRNINFFDNHVAFVGTPKKSTNTINQKLFYYPTLFLIKNYFMNFQLIPLTWLKN